MKLAAFLGLIVGIAGHPVPVTWQPERPAQGSLVALRSDTAATGTFAGEPLHFEATATGYRAFGAIPLDASDTVWGEVTARGATERIAIAVSNRAVSSERLNAAPRFGRQPDSALNVRLERERAQIRAVLAATHERPRLWHEPFIRPIPGRLLSTFGSTRVFNGRIDSRHRGVDFAAATGDPIKSANRGVVVIVAHHYYAGRSVWVDHGAGVLTAYLHMSKTEVAVGDTVRRGQVLGRVGMTGRVTAPHLHWSALYGRIGFDPLDLLGPLASVP